MARVVPPLHPVWLGGIVATATNVLVTWAVGWTVARTLILNQCGTMTVALVKFQSNVWYEIIYFVILAITVTECGGSNLTCCTSIKPCQEGGGTCISNDQCEGDLGCGVDNCGDFHNGSQWFYDCCTGQERIGICIPWKNKINVLYNSWEPKISVTV